MTAWVVPIFFVFNKLRGSLIDQSGFSGCQAPFKENWLQIAESRGLSADSCPPLFLRGSVPSG